MIKNKKVVCPLLPLLPGIRNVKATNQDIFDLNKIVAYNLKQSK
jgi:hypothetical protein